MALRILFFALGYLEVQVEGERIERLINLALSRGIHFWDLHWEGSRLLLKMGTRAFKRLRPLRRKCGVRLSIVRRGGLPFLLRGLSRRWVPIAVAGALALGLYLLSTYVWFIEIEGLRATSPHAVLRAAAELGLRPGVPRRAIDPERITDRLPLLVPGIAWAGLDVRGTKAVLRLSEAASLPPGLDPASLGEPGDLVARRPALITKVLALRGEARVRPGDTVVRGQVLISGTVSLPAPPAATPPEGGEGGGEIAEVRARGVVLARTWYRRYEEQPLTVKAAVPTGRSATAWEWRWAGSGIRFGRAPAFADYEVHRRALLPGYWRNTWFPAELLELRYDEVVRHERRLTGAEAVARAETAAKNRLLEQIPIEARILRQEVRLVQQTRSRVGVEVWIETEEPIGELRPYSAAGDGRPGRLPPSAGRADDDPQPPGPAGE